MTYPRNSYVSGNVDPGKSEQLARYWARLYDETTIVHYHAYGQGCTDKCHTVTPESVKEEEDGS